MLMPDAPATTLCSEIFDKCRVEPNLERCVDERPMFARYAEY